MLILTRKIHQSIIIGDHKFIITILGIKGNQVRLGIEGPRDIPIHRDEIFFRIKQRSIEDNKEHDNGESKNDK